MTVKVRFAPSPTGPLHIGGLRTALYNYLFAKQKNGIFILRIEDTDQTRYVPGAEEYIIESLEWTGLIPDLSPLQSDEKGPYRQSERKHIYQQYAHELVERGWAYYAFDTPEELEAMRRRLKAMGKETTHYNYLIRDQMKNSLSLPTDEVKARLNAGEPYVIRMKVPVKQEVRFYDEIRGWVIVHTSQIDDKVLLKADGMPTYHLANVVDDHLMEITHVIRGEEWLPSTPLHVLLYQAFGWEMPSFAHLPLILRPDGNGKLSKRDGDQFGFPVFPLEWKDPQTGETVIGYREKGFLPEALLNFLAFLGWNPGTEQEIFSLPELIEAFDIKRVGKAGVRFNYQKALWFNQQHIRNKKPDTFLPLLKKQIQDANLPCPYSDDQLLQIISLAQERVSLLTEFLPETIFFFTQPNLEPLQNELSNLIPETNFITYLQHVLNDLKSLNDEEWNENTISEILKKRMKEMKLKPKQAFLPLRILLTGQKAGPELPSIISLLGKKETLNRLLKSLTFIQNLHG